MRGCLGKNLAWPEAGGFGVRWRAEQAAYGTSRKPFPIVTVLLSDPVTTPIYTKKGKIGINGQNGRSGRKVLSVRKTLTFSADAIAQLANTFLRFRRQKPAAISALVAYLVNVAQLAGTHSRTTA
jgi:hypothetical protein